MGAGAIGGGDRGCGGDLVAGWAVGRLRAAGCVFAEEEAGLLVSAAGSRAQLVAVVRRRAAGEPLEHLLGWVRFCGLRLRVDPGVFVPRQRTRLLVRLAATHAQGAAPGTVVVDLCCGSGAVGAAVAAALARAGAGIRLFAADIDPAAVRCARHNLARFGAQVLRGDLFEALPPQLRGTVHVLVANVPYVPTGAIGLMPAEARLHEPRAALDGGPDGLDVLRRVAAQAPAWLAPGGRLFIETSTDQAAPAAVILRAHALTPRATHAPHSSATVITGQL